MDRRPEEAPEDRLRGELQDALEQQRATAEVMKILTRSQFDPASLFKVIVNSALRLCEADNATLALFEAGRALVAANAGEFRDESTYNAAFGDIALEPDPSTIVGRVLLSKATVHITSFQGSGLRRPPGPATGARCVIAVPLLRDGEVIGTLIARRRRELPFSERHTHLLETFADQAVIAIENTRLFNTVKRQSDELCRFLSPQVADLITSRDGIALLDGHRRQITAVCCDIHGFTAFAEMTDPEEVLGVLRGYHAAMGELIARHGGTLERFTGDALMVFFNDPVAVEDHERAGVRLACAMRDVFAEIAVSWKKKGYELSVGIGVAVGYATLGRIGFEGRYDYGAVGNVVTLASRLASQAHDGQILVSERVHAAIEADVESTSLGTLSVSGLTRPVAAFGVVSIR